MKYGMCMEYIQCMPESTYMHLSKELVRRHQQRHNKPGGNQSFQSQLSTLKTVVDGRRVKLCVHLADLVGEPQIGIDRSKSC